MRTFYLALIAIVAGAALALGHVSEARSAPSAANVPIYLAIGDSLAYGMQIGHLKQEMAAGSVHASSFDTGYVNDLAAHLRATQPSLKVVDLGCPGETTSSFINGPCAFATNGKPFGTKPLPMHVHYTGSQLATALDYLSHHAENVELVTLTIGINDLRAIELKCPAKGFNDCVAAGWPAALVHTKANLHTMLTRLKAAAPHAKFLVMTYYNWLGAVDPASDGDVEELNAAIVAAAHAAGMGTVDTFTAFNRTGNEHARVCKLTLFCGPTKDLHPTNAGYRLIAGLFEKAY